MSPARLEIIRQSTYKTVPWKNGGGITREAWREPATGEDFRCRLSVARVDASGVFSDFSAYQRKMVLLQGGGVELRFADQSTLVLREVGDLAEFDGAIATYGRLLAGPCVDLNLIVNKRDRAEASIERLEHRLLEARGAQILLVFPLNRPFALLVDGERTTLHPWDLAVLRSGRASLTALDEHAQACATGYAADVFLASLELVGGE